MKRVLLSAIELYWRLIVPDRRRHCIFRESCSLHVHRITRDQGVIKGISAFAHRFRRCRGGYAVTFDEHLNPSLLLVDGTTIPIVEAADSVLAMVKGTVNVVRQVHQSPSHEFCKPPGTAHAVAGTGYSPTMSSSFSAKRLSLLILNKTGWSKEEG
jgi:putative component of membrane protein insertase Oxa1/YidC/SpoIIIJ protein YidD